MTFRRHVASASELKGEPDVKLAATGATSTDWRKMSFSEESQGVALPCVLITSCDDSFKGEELVKGRFDTV